MRIIAVPLTRPRRTNFPVSSSTSLGSSSSSQSSTNNAKPSRLTYYQFQITAKKKKVKANEGDAQNPEKKEKKGWLPEEGLVNFATQKAANIWAGFGKAEGGWRLKTFQFGERLVDRMEFEELALKSIDPSLGPSIRHLKQRPLADEKGSGPPTIPLIFPPSIVTPSMALSELKAYTAHRIPRHRRGFWGWMLVAPFTAPFMIIPIIPNLPFFFCVWRSWSHYRAYRSSKYLQSLIEHDVIAPEASEALDEVYKLRSIEEPTSSTSSTPYSDSTPASSSSTSKSAPSFNPSTSEPHSTSNPSSQSSPSAEPKHDVLLTRDAVPSILAIFELKPDVSAATDLYRAIEQARLRVASGREEL
ncbi:hypothetical protein NLJ89_g2430 [Agrocybe chaxingu]|uniref:Mitochondrial K+-H+ exchange-related-domain-containing protein n=1 Tax=Agrocybe chaxingu TaxID=84603 RepID=A0A9W8MYQ5_9AGAR|nr:hypothetical protein NLJ89_g2430 [Agrocybe chaxingu]